MKSREGASGHPGIFDGSPFSKESYRKLFGFLRHHLPAQDVDDALQESYKRFLEIPAETVAQNPQAYVFGIAWKVVCNFRTARRTEPVSFDSERMESVAAQSLAASPEAPLEKILVCEELYLALNELPLPKQEIVLHRALGYSDRDISRLVGKPLNTVKKYATTTLGWLRQRGRRRNET